jgi:hypothetical protein
MTLVTGFFGHWRATINGEVLGARPRGLETDWTLFINMCILVPSLLMTMR